MLTPLVLAALTLDPAAPPQDFAAQLDHAEITAAGAEGQIIGYDAAGEVIGVIAIWMDEHHRFHLASDYADGHGETVVHGDHADTAATLPGVVLAERAELMAERLVAAPGSGPAEGWFTCAATVAIAVAGCSISSAAVILTCPGGVALAVCECGPALEIEVKVCDR